MEEWVQKLWSTYTVECYSASEQDVFESVLMKPIVQNEVSQKEEDKHGMFARVRGEVALMGLSSG